MEEKRLKAIDPIVSDYLQFISKIPEVYHKKNRLIRALFNLSLKLSSQLFTEATARAHRYKITERDTIERNDSLKDYRYFF